MRIDVALFGLRLFKSRSQAQAAITNGEVLLDGYPVRASHELAPGARVTVLSPRGPRTFEILGLPTRSLSRDAARELLREVAESP